MDKIKDRTFMRPPHLAKSSILAILKKMKKGKLVMTLPDKRQLIFGEESHGPQAEIIIYSHDFFQRCFLEGDIGFGESYMLKEWDTPNLYAVISWMISNIQDNPALSGGKKSPLGFGLFSLLNKVSQLRKKNSKSGSLKNISFHYDLNNQFFESFLDKSMAYSCALFKNPEQSLEEAQEQKFEQLCQSLELSSQDHLLEIGCGWGSFSLYAAQKYGCLITAITISQEQYQFFKEKIVKNKLEDKINLKFLDFRDIPRHEKYNKIVSIEMMEALGQEGLTTFLKKCHELLDSKGMMVFQYITCPDERYKSIKQGVDWIQKHIFPGSLLLSNAQILKTLSRFSDLNLYQFKDYGPHYALTLKKWFERFEKNQDSIKALGYDQTFIRKWSYYLNYCEAAFAQKNISVVQASFTRTNNSDLRDFAFLSRR